MFSSNPSHASLICPSVFTSYENRDFMLNHYHHQQLGVDPLTGLILPAANQHHHHYLENMGLTAYNNTTLSAEHYVDASANNLIGNKKTPAAGASKRGRHSKICTAQGFRDRRVRLSIQIARKFFDLQDMLGFEKASNTLEWLLSKSRNAIGELVELKKLPCNNKQLAVDGNASEEKKIAKESRDKARARARQRTRDKSYYYCNNKSSSTSSQQEQDTISCHDDKFRAPQQSSSYVVAPDDQLVQEPCSRTLAAAAACQVQRDRKQKYPSSDFANNQLQNLEISKDAISCNTTTSSYCSNLPQNWEIISARPRYHSTFGTITNHEQ